MAKNDPQFPPDPTPSTGAPTDVSRVSRSGAKPQHERTADEEAATINWQGIAASARFKELIRAKKAFIIPAMIVFVLYYFALPILVGYAPALMDKPVWGPVNLAYLFALSQFFMAWIIAALYVRAASRFDKQAHEIISKDAAQS